MSRFMECFNRTIIVTDINDDQVFFHESNHLAINHVFFSVLQPTDTVIKRINRRQDFRQVIIVVNHRIHAFMELLANHAQYADVNTRVLSCCNTPTPTRPDRTGNDNQCVYA